MRETIEPLMTGYLRKGGLSVGLRALLRITTDQNFRETWTKDLEHLLSKESELSRKELKEKVANGVDLDVLRSRGATEHELEVAGVPVGKLDDAKMVEEDEFEEMLKNVILQSEKLKTEEELSVVASSLKDLNTLTNYMNILVKDTTDYMTKTETLISNSQELVAHRLTKDWMIHWHPCMQTT